VDEDTPTNDDPLGDNAINEAPTPDPSAYPLPGRESAVSRPPSMARIAGCNWGGRRPGAGAPRGNMNGLKHGKYSARHRRLVAIIASIPEVRDGLLAIGRRRRRQQRLAEAGASELLAGLLQRAGDIVLNPQPNHVEANQDLLDFLRDAEATLRQISKTQSREAAKIHGSIKRDRGSENVAG
jgi:hypothetical protein